MDKMNLVDDFNDYLVDWCHKNHFPVPKEQFTEHWKLAWADYVKDVLEPNYDKINQYYTNLEYATTNTNHSFNPITIDEPELDPHDFNSAEDQVVENKTVDKIKQPANDWEVVKKLMES